MPTRCVILVRSAITAAVLVLLSILVLDGPVALAFSSAPTEVKRAFTKSGGRVRMAVRLSGVPVSIRRTTNIGGTCGEGIETRESCSIPDFHRLGTCDSSICDRHHEATVFPASAIRSSNGEWLARYVVRIRGEFLPLRRCRPPFELVLSLWWSYFRRFWIPLVILPVLISVARVLVNGHYLSDVIASADS